MLALAATLAALAWPRLQASVTYLPVDKALARHWSGDTPAPDQLAALSNRALQALAQHDHYRYRDGLSILEYLRAQAPGLPADDLKQLALKLERQGLGKAAAGVWREYLEKAGGSEERPGAIWYRIGTLHQAAEAPKLSIDW